MQFPGVFKVLRVAYTEPLNKRECSLCSTGARKQIVPTAMVVHFEQNGYQTRTSTEFFWITKKDGRCRLAELLRSIRYGGSGEVEGSNFRRSPRFIRPLYGAVRTSRRTKKREKNRSGHCRTVNVKIPPNAYFPNDPRNSRVLVTPCVGVSV